MNRSRSISYFYGFFMEILCRFRGHCKSYSLDNRGHCKSYIVDIVKVLIVDIVKVLVANDYQSQSWTL